jgi:molecular chaperone GrpE
MSESETPGVPGDIASSGPGAVLTPGDIDAVLEDFRVWLTQLATASSDPVDLPRETVDLHTLVAQFTALRQEVNLQTRAVRTQQEQSAETLKQYGEAVKLLEEAAEQVAESQQREAENTIMPLLKGLIEVADTQALAAKELYRVLAGVAEMIDRSKAADAEKYAVAPRLPLLARLSGASHVLARQQQLIDRLESRLKSRETSDSNAESIRTRLEAAALGLTMGLQRIDRTMRQHGLEPIPAIGRPFDPEQMEVIDTIADSGKPSGEVVDELRRGYLWNENVFRFAQVRVAK